MPLIETLDWRSTNAPPQAVVLSNARIGNYLSVRTSLLAYVGHVPETIDYAAKLEQAERRTLYTSSRIAYVIVSPDEQKAPDGSPTVRVLSAPQPDLDPVYEQGGNTIFKVVAR